MSEPVHWLDARISVYSTVYDTTGRDTTIRHALERLKSPQDQARIVRLRQILTTQGHDAYNAAKLHTPALTFAGRFTAPRSKETVAQSSGIVHYDLDHIPDMQALRATLERDQYVAYVFTSPSGDGLKLGLLSPMVDSDPTYKWYWGQGEQYLTATYHVSVDPSGKDISRLCFRSWDPTTYTNPEAIMLAFSAPPEREPPPTVERPILPPPTNGQDKQAYYADRALQTAVKLIDASEPGGRHHARLQAAYLLGGYIGGGIVEYDTALAALETAVARNTAHYDRAMKTIVDGLTTGQAKPITLDDCRRDSERWRSAHPRPQRQTPEPGSNGHSRKLDHEGPSRRPLRPEDNPDFVDPWLGKRSEWHGVPTAVRRPA